MKTLTAMVVALLSIAAAEAAVVRFISPLPGAQLFARQTIEITTDAESVDRVEFHVDGVLAGVARRVPYRTTFDFGTTLEPHVIEAKVFSRGFTQIDTARFISGELGGTDTYDVDLVEVPLRIRSSRKLSVADLRVRENGVEQKPREILPTRGPAHFVFVVDRSLSMGDGKLLAALNAIDAERKLLRPGDTASFVLFNHIVSRARSVAGGESVARIAGTLTPSGGTSLRDAVASAAASKRTYTIVITDGGDRNSALSEDEALRRVSGTQGVVSAIILGVRSPFLEKAATNSGGRVATATASSLQRALHDLLVEINSRYLLVYQSAGTPKGWRAITVTSRRKGVEVASAKRGYFSP